MIKQRLVSGIQPTGTMHLGNYFGAIQNWITLQNEFDAYFMIADYHSLTTLYDNPSQLKSYRENLIIDLLASGVSPEKCCLFFQSDVPEHTELHLLLSMITPLPWLTRVPNYKGKIADLQEKDLDTYGFLGYPVLMAADILLYRAAVVPVGRDQLAHLELTREIARRFNHFYGDYFPEPEEKLTATPTVIGLDGRKMSKSYNNTIALSEDNESSRSKVMKMVTDPARIKRTDPGTPANCPVFSFHEIFSSQADKEWVKEGCTSAGIGCVDCKKKLLINMEETLEPIREKRRHFEAHKADIQDMLKAGTKKARTLAQETISAVKSKIGL